MVIIVLDTGKEDKTLKYDFRKERDFGESLQKVLESFQVHKDDREKYVFQNKVNRRFISKLEELCN